MMDILTIGSTTIDLFLHVPNSDGVNSLVEEGSKTCFYPGSKIGVDHFQMTPGGNALNVAVGASTLGLKAQIYTELGEDEFTKDIIEVLKNKKVNTDLCFGTKGTRSNVGTVIIHDSERTIFSYHEKHEYKSRDFGTPKIIYFTSIPEGNETFQKILINHVSHYKNTILAYNPGSGQINAGVDSIKDVLQVTDILFLNKEEAEVLTKEAPVDKLHKLLQALGPKLTVITDGRNGASASANGKVVNIKAFTDDKPVVDMTGAGDAFSSGFLSAIHYKKPLREALIWGAVNSASVIKEIGATKGLLDKKTMEAIVASVLK